MYRWPLLTLVFVLTSVMSAGLVGCDDDDDDNGIVLDGGILDAAPDDAGNGDGDAALPDGANGDAALPDGAVGELTCEEEVQADGDTSPECAACLCESCESELQTCNATPGCQDEVSCAQTAVSDGTCDPEDTACVLEECEPSSAAVTFLLCVQGNCLDDCA
ncbi:MAG: hypothetical protein ACOC97_03150 [Myxococcota bacterium]